MKHFWVKPQIAVVFFLGVIMLILGLGVSQVLAYTDPGDIAECERLNVLNGCDCDCRDSNSVCEFVAGLNKYQCQGRSAPLVTNSTGKSGLPIRFFPSLGTGGGIFIVDGSGDVLIGQTVVNIFRWIFILIGVAVIFFGLYGGFLYSTAGSDDDQVEKGRNTLKNAIIGFIICIAALFIVSVIANVLGFEDGNIIVDKAIDTNTSNKATEEQEQKDIFDRLFRF